MSESTTPAEGVSPYLRFEECPSLLTKTEAAAILRVSQSTVDEWIARDRSLLKGGRQPANRFPVICDDRTSRVLVPSWLLPAWIEAECRLPEGRLSGPAQREGERPTLVASRLPQVPARRTARQAVSQVLTFVALLLLLHLTFACLWAIGGQ